MERTVIDTSHKNRVHGHMHTLEPDRERAAAQDKVPHTMVKATAIAQPTSPQELDVSRDADGLPPPGPDGGPPPGYDAFGNKFRPEDLDGSNARFEAEPGDIQFINIREPGPPADPMPDSIEPVSTPGSQRRAAAPASRRDRFTAQASDFQIMHVLKPHILSPNFESALRLKDGVLHPVLSLAHEDKDVILEIRDERIDLYSKGNIIFQVERAGNNYVIIPPDKAFSKKPGFRAGSGYGLISYIDSEIPFIKQRIARHRPRGNELEFEQAIVRATNFEQANSHYLIVDRQVAMPVAGQVDCVGIAWRNHARLEAFPLLCEVKYLAGAVGYLSIAIEQYYEFFRCNTNRR